MNHQIPNQMKIKSLLFCLFAFAFGFPQSHKAAISKIENNEVHKIAITPEIRSASNDNLDYFRILDKNKKEVPYVVFDNSDRNALYFQKLDILSRKTIDDSLTSIVISVFDLKNVTELSLFISNTKINKTYSISGSNNQQDWFGLVSNQDLFYLNNENGTFVKKTISFPKNNYKFLRLDFNDKKSLPINVLEIGYFKGNKKSIEITDLTDFQYKISEDKKNKKTIITFSSGDFQKVDGISFDVKTKMFFRNASVFVYRTRKVKKRTQNVKDKVSSFSLSSNISNSFQLNDFFEKEFTVEIENLDNQPLEISKIKLSQNTISVVADLKANEKYEVIIDSTLSKPQYDLAIFTTDFVTGLPVATILKLNTMDSESKNDSEKTFWQNPIFLWSAIFLTLLLLAYFVFSMLKDVDKK